MLLDGAGCAQRAAETGGAAQRAGEGDGERARPEIDQVDEHGAAVSRFDGEPQSGDAARLTSRLDAVRSGERDGPALARPLVHKVRADGKSASNSSIAASTVSARETIWSR